MPASASFAVFTDPWMVPFIMSFLPGLPHVLLAFEHDVYAGLIVAARTLYYQGERHNQSSAGMWLAHALIRSDRRIYELVRRLHSVPYYAAMPLFASVQVDMDHVCRYGVVSHLQAIHDTVDDISAVWSSELLHDVLKDYQERLSNREPDPTRLHELESIALWLLQHHPEACGTPALVADGAMLAPERRGFVEALLRANVLYFDPPRSPRLWEAPMLADEVVALALRVNPSTITRSIAQYSASCGYATVLHRLHDSRHLLAADFFSGLLTLAARNGHVDALKVLSPYRTDSDVKEALGDAIHSRNVEVAEFLQQFSPTQRISMPSIRRSTPAMDEIRIGIEPAPVAEWCTRADELYAVLANSPTLEDYTRLHTQHHPRTCNAMCARFKATHFELALRCNEPEIAAYLVDTCHDAWVGEPHLLAVAKSSCGYEAARKLLRRCHIDERRRASRALMSAAERGDLAMVRLLYEHDVPCTSYAVWDAVEAENGLAVAKYLTRKHPSDLTNRAYHEAWKRGEPEMFMMLHAKYHHRYCSSKMLEYPPSQWTLLVYMHKHCTRAQMSEEAAWHHACDAGSQDLFVFMWCVRRDACVTKRLNSVSRDKRLRIYHHLLRAVPSLFQSAQQMPWCCQLHALRRRVVRGMVTLKEVEAARMGSQ